MFVKFLEIILAALCFYGVYALAKLACESVKIYVTNKRIKELRETTDKYCGKE